MTDDQINESIAKDPEAYHDGSVPVWRFAVEADRLPNGRYKVELRTRSGRVFNRVGYNPLWELIRIFGANRNALAGGDSQTKETK